MTELKCPFCQQELKDQWVGQNVAHEYFDCPKCKMNGNTKLWQELIRTRKALNFAISTLTVIGEGCVIEHSVVGHEDDNKIKLAKIALDKIKIALEQKDVK